MNQIQSYLDIINTDGAQLFHALLITLELLVLSSAVGFILALPLAVGRTSRNRVIYGLSSTYSAAFRGTPLLVQLFIFYYGLAQFQVLRGTFLWDFLGNSFLCAVIVLTLNVTAYMAEHVRAGILNVPLGEREAALSVGLSQFRIYAFVIIPRALRVATPALGNEVIAQLKSTALASTITVLDMTGYVRRLSAQSYTTDPLILAAVIYAIVTFLIGLSTRYAERRGGVYLKR
jgi:polar amino acid transport system permease protein